MKSTTIGPDDKLYNSRIIATYIMFLKKEYSHVNIDDVLSYARMEIYQVEDDSYWFTQEQVDRFNERVVKLTGETRHIKRSGSFWLFS